MSYESLGKIYYKNNEKYEDIYQSRFNSEFTIKFDFNIGEHQSFLVINNDILTLVSAIMKSDKNLSKASLGLPPIALKYFLKRCLIDEIQITNEIEGVRSTKREIRALVDTKEKSKEKKRLYGLVQKYKLLLSDINFSLDTCEDIRTLYDEFVLAEVERENVKNIPDGKIFRKDMVEIISPSQKVIHKGVFPEEKIIDLLTKALNVLKVIDINPLVKIALFHYMFGYIHPFYDGNGRVSRFISSYLLNKELEKMVGFSLSNSIKNKISKYYDIFNITNEQKNKGDMTPFVIGFLELINDGVENLYNVIESKKEQLDFYQKIINGYADDNKSVINILYILVQNALFDDEGLDVVRLSQITKLSDSSIRAKLKDLKAFVTSGFVGKKKVYSANLEELSLLKK